MMAIVEARQLDLFVDGRDAALVNEVVAALESRAVERAEAALGRLRDEHPAHPDLHAPEPTHARNVNEIEAAQACERDAKARDVAICEA